MSDRLGAWFPMLLLALLAALTFWLDRIVQIPFAARDHPLRHDPDYIVDALSAVRMDERGRVKDTLAAQKMVHYPDDDTTLLTGPKFVTYTETRSPVTVTSREALVSSNGENIYFKEDVRVVRAATAGQSELVLETSSLHVIPDDKTAKTDQPVTVRDANAVVTASGLELNSETRVLKLQGRVKGIYHDRTRARSSPR